ncbi:MAG: single-stranded DNA-binding protein [Sulfurihydrogenibium azorense]|uniref:single-stranded DNA-binding protein n=1 Tax=Sulfurihydrogenibium azorense TaxID=309806 RepID=UPI00391CB401
MINRVIITGRLTKEPEVRLLTTGTPVAKMTIAVNRNYKKKDSQDWQQKTYFFDVEAMGVIADRLAKLNKGELVLVEGELRQDRWQDQDGKNKSKTKIHAIRIVLVNKPSTSTATTQPIDENLEELEIPREDIEEDVPF